MVVLTGTTSTREVSSVIVDNVEAGKSVVKHLGALGHRRIGVVAGPEGHSRRSTQVGRYALGLRAWHPLMMRQLSSAANGTTPGKPVTKADGTFVPEEGQAHRHMATDDMIAFASCARRRK